jgi:N6-L-threonylcarbamoyladenine synthase
MRSAKTCPGRCRPHGKPEERQPALGGAQRDRTGVPLSERTPQILGIALHTALTAPFSGDEEKRRRHEAGNGTQKGRVALYYRIMRILGIETSCDETAAALVRDGRHVEANVIASSQLSFRATGGVIPEQAARRQVEYVIPTIVEALRGTGITPREIDAIAVTKGPGLLGSLLVGSATARVLSLLWKKPLIGVHHTLGHLTSTWLGTSEEPVFPILTLSASGGHTELWLRLSHTKGTLLGRTRDDAAGEAFDKGASLLGLPYPGGPSIAERALQGNPQAIAFPLPLTKEDTLDFSFSGLKTSLRYAIRDAGPLSETMIGDLAASYQYALCRHLCDRVKRALKHHAEIREVHIVGGVSANTLLRETLRSLCGEGITLRVPTQLSYCTDNAAMIASAGYYLQLQRPELARSAFVTSASLPLAEAIESA